MPTLSFDPAKDVPDLTGKVILVTGGTTGIGAHTIINLARHNPSHLIFTGRNAESADATIAAARSSTSSPPKITFLPLDLASLATVQSATNSLLSTLSRLDTLVLNAGVMALPPGLSTDGYEIQFATNHLGQAFFLQKLLPLLERTASSQNSDVRIIILTSVALTFTPSEGIAFEKLKTEQKSKLGGRWQRYGQSKLANFLYARELAKRLGKKGIQVLAVHPGVVETGLVTKMGWGDKMLIYLPNLGRVLSPEEGSWNTLWAMTVKKERLAEEDGEDGGFSFYEPVGVRSKMMTRWMKDERLGESLWEWTEGELSSWM